MPISGRNKQAVEGRNRAQGTLGSLRCAVLLPPSLASLFFKQVGGAYSVPIFLKQNDEMDKEAWAVGQREGRGKIGHAFRINFSQACLANWYRFKAIKESEVWVPFQIPENSF